MAKTKTKHKKEDECPIANPTYLIMFCFGLRFKKEWEILDGMTGVLNLHIGKGIALVFSSAEQEVRLGHLSALVMEAFSLYGLISEITYPLWL